MNLKKSELETPPLLKADLKLKVPEEGQSVQDNYLFSPGVDTPGHRLEGQV
jgi:hypothetical protein